MKTLDVSSLRETIETTKNEITNRIEKLTNLQTSVQGIINLETQLKGQTGESIRSFYESIHEPFLIFLCESLESYSEILDNVQEAVSSYESNEQGLVKEEFLDEDVKDGLDKVQDVTDELVDDANTILEEISDLVSIPAIDMDELGKSIQKGKKKVTKDLEQLHELDAEQTEALSEVKEDQNVLQQYINDMDRNFSRNSSITGFDALSTLEMSSLPTILKEVYDEPESEEKEDSHWWDTPIDSVKGTGLGVFDFAGDTVTGLWNTVRHPIETTESLGTAVIHPVDTTKNISSTIKESFVRDMINGDAESRAHWTTYALGTTATSIVGTKGAGSVSKTGAATTKAGAKKATSKAAQNVKNAELPNLLPYNPRYQPAINRNNIPYNVVDGQNLKDQLIWKAEKVQSAGNGLSKAKPEKVVNDLASFQSKKMIFGDQQFLLDKKGMKHILMRHHPKYWNGSIKKNQTFLNENFTANEVVNIAERVMQQNRDTLMNRGTNSTYQITGTVNGVEYVVGLNKGRIGQLYSK